MPDSGRVATTLSGVGGEREGERDRETESGMEIHHLRSLCEESVGAGL